MWAHTIIAFIQEVEDQGKEIRGLGSSCWSCPNRLWLSFSCLPKFGSTPSAGGLTSCNSASLTICQAILPSQLCRFAASSDLQSWV